MSVSYETADKALAARMGDKSLAHSRGVSQAAGQLALIYGVDTEEARLAGLLHDWDRELSHDELASRAAAAGLPTSAAEEASPRLLHARTGAVALREAVPGLSSEVLTAIERHTLGDPRMGPLDMVVYVADMIEPGRHYQGVDDLREAAGTISLEELFAEAYRHSVSHLIKARKPIHPLTVEVWNTLVARRRP
ncbi:MAG: bis(5'-nucleosyl)-tetraphosphatase (symmetrical) YqeK [Coriobacteriia bacterium]|nr:bis(5'-nucleosyl)-tetraphosphatase (symmetrical) YqeK [Coriobacteriia bacterium]